MAKTDKSILKGFIDGGASDAVLDSVGGKYRRAILTINARRVTVFKIPTTSHLDDRAIWRKARDMARRFNKYNTDALTW